MMDNNTTKRGGYVLAIGDLGQVLLHILALFAVALIVVRLMGNRTVGQFSPFDFVIMVGIGDIIVTASMDKNQTMLDGVEGLAALFILQQLLAYLSLKSTTLRKWFEGTPITLIQDGQIIRENFVKTQFNYDDLRQELHRQGMDMTNLKDIKLARLESCGVFSVIKKIEKEPLTKQDFESYFKTMRENPLSPAGEQWAKIDQLISDVHQLTQFIRQQEKQVQPNYVKTQHKL
ncbi:MAG: YetF domain-containing protein [Veillonellales bacterium]